MNSDGFMLTSSACLPVYLNHENGVAFSRRENELLRIGQSNNSHQSFTNSHVTSCDSLVPSNIIMPTLPYLDDRPNSNYMQQIHEESPSPPKSSSSPTDSAAVPLPTSNHISSSFFYPDESILNQHSSPKHNNVDNEATEPTSTSVSSEKDLNSLDASFKMLAPHFKAEII